MNKDKGLVIVHHCFSPVTPSNPSPGNRPIEPVQLTTKTQSKSRQEDAQSPERSVPNQVQAIHTWQISIM